MDLEASLDLAQRLIQGGIGGSCPNPTSRRWLTGSGLRPGTSHHRPASRVTSPSPRGTRPRPSRNSTGCGPPGRSSSPGTTSCCARPCAPRHRSRPQPGRGRPVITVNGTPVPYADQFAWVQAGRRLPARRGGARARDRHRRPLGLNVQIVGPYPRPHRDRIRPGTAYLIGRFTAPLDVRGRDRLTAWPG